MIKFKKVTSMVIAICMVMTFLPNIIASAAITGAIRLPESIENGTMTVTKGGTPLSDGDSVSEGDTLDFTLTPAEGYAQQGGVTSGTKTLAADDFSFAMGDIVVDTEANSAWRTTDNYQDTGKSGYVINFPGNDTSYRGTKSFTHTENFEAGEAAIAFDWAINQGFIKYGEFTLKFYHNNELKITHDFRTTANPYSNILHDTYKFTSEGTGDTFRWDFEKVSSSDWADSSGRTAYIANIKKSTDEYEYIPETPVFLKTGTIQLPESIENGTMTVTKDGVQLSDGDSITVGDKLVFTVTPSEGYRQISGIESVTKTIAETDFTDSVYSPEVPVFAKILFAIENKAAGFITVAETASLGDTVTFALKELDGAKITGLTITDANQNEITLTPISDTEYSFTMPKAAVTISGQIELNLSTDESGAYLINSADNMLALSIAVNNGYDTTDKKYKLTADISLTTEAGFMPIGTSANPFKGIFDGQGHTLNVTLSGGSSIAPFAYAGNSTIENLTVTGTISASDKYAAGIVSSVAAGSKLTMNKCLSGVTIESSVNGDGTHGGLAGVVSGNAEITNCGFFGAINGSNTYSCGGLVGWSNDTVNISNSYVAGSFNLKSSDSSDSSYTFSRNPSKAAINNCYYLTALKNLNEGATKLSESDFNLGKATWLLNDFSNSGEWKQTINTDLYPCFTGAAVYRCTCAGNTYYGNTEGNYDSHNYSHGFCTRCGAYEALTQIDGVYQINNVFNLLAFADIVNNGEKDANAVLTADIDLEKTPWTTIAETDLYHKAYGTDLGYSGTFDGAGHTIKNLALSSSSTRESSCGLFGTVSGTVKNLGIDGVTFTDGGKDLRAGAIAGQLIKSSGLISNCYVSNAVITPGEHVVGGIAGCVYEGTIENCLVHSSSLSGTTSSGNKNRYGHIVGDSRADGSTTDRFGTVKNCYTDNSLAYSTQSGTITNCNGSVTADTFASGSVAYLLQGDRETQIWGQTIGTDAYPVLGGAKVYKKYTSCIDFSYTNNADEEQTTPLAHNYNANKICTVCGANKPFGPNADGIYEISNADELVQFRNEVKNGNTSIKGKLTADIDLSTICGENINGRKVNWTPIGDDSNKFAGVFDGDGHKITNLYIKSSDDYQGLFGCISSGGEVKNVTVDGGTVSGSYYVGAVAGRNYGTITNCYNTGAVSGAYVGGVAGSNDGTITNCYNTGAVSGGSYVGGVAGLNYSTITNCYNTGAISGNRDVGGVVGYNSNTITNCYNTGAVSGNSEVGGVAGGNYGTVTNCYYLTGSASGGISGSDKAGSAESKTIEEFASGSVAYLLQGDRETQVWGQTIGTDAYPVLGGAKVYKKYTSCIDLSYTGNANEEQTTPLAHNYAEDGICTVCSAYKQLEPNADGVYEIDTAPKLLWFENEVNNGNTSIKGKLTADIDLSTICGENINGKAVNWTPIGNESNKFTGTFDGDGHKITNLYINSSDDYQGLFGYISSGSEVKNVTVDGGTVSGGTYVGGVIGYNYYGGTITDCYNTGAVSGSDYVGGVAGLNYGTITNCYNTGAVSGNSDVGGVVGYNSNTLTNCYNTGTVSGNSEVGGVAGLNHDTITNCYNTGTVSGNSEVGGVAGLNYGRITNCYYLTGSASGGIDGSDNAGSAESKTIEEFANGSIAYLLQDNRETPVWGQTIGTDAFPVLGGARVYIKYTSCIDFSYTNSADEAQTTPLAHNYADGICTACGKYMPIEPEMNGDVYEIDTALKLLWFENEVNNGNTSIKGKLTADIDLSAVCGENINGRELNWTPIGNSSNKFTGAFDGDGHKITNLYINSSDDYQGLFGYIGQEGEVKNVGVDGGTVSGGMVGGIAGMNEGTVTNCYNTGAVSDGDGVGGIVGYNGGTVTDCYNAGAVSLGSGVGGIAGVNEGTVTNCYNTGAISLGDYCVGGIVGYNVGTVTDCYNTGSVSDGYCVGGIAGVNYGSDYYDDASEENYGMITNCHNTGMVSNGDEVGGIVGDNGGTVTDCYNTGTVSEGEYCVGGIAGDNSGTVTDCYNTGAVSEGECVGGIVGDNYAAVTDCYNTGTVSDGEYVGGVVGDNEEDTVTNCYYLTGSAAGGINGSDTAGSAESKTTEEFADGSVAYILHGNRETRVWGQTIGTDASPVLTSDSGKAVYKVTFATQDNAEYAVKYANPSGAGKLPIPPVSIPTHAFCKWSQTNSADGKEFTDTTLITQDITVYAVSEEMYGENDNEKTVTTTCGISQTQNLSEYTVFAGDTLSAGKFTYTIESGNDTLGAEIDGDILTVPDTAPSGDYTLKIKAENKEPQGIMLMSVDFDNKPVTFEVNVTVNPVENNSLVFTDDGDVIATSTSSGTFCVVFAAYDENGVLQSVKSENVTFEHARSKIVQKPEDFEDNDADTVKAFFWKSLSDMTPICPAA